MAKKKRTRTNAVTAKPRRADEIRWQTEADLSMLQRAKEVEADKTRMRRVRQLAKQQQKDLAQIAKFRDSDGRS